MVARSAYTPAIEQHDPFAEHRRIMPYLEVIKALVLRYMLSA
jgi:hypothetical protein